MLPKVKTHTEDHLKLFPHWIPVNAFQFSSCFFQVDSAEFIHCKEMVDEYLHSLEFSLPTNAVYIFDSAQIQEQQRAWSSSQRLRLARRGRGSSQQGDLDEYCDGLKRLYEEMDSEVEAGNIKGLFESQQEGVSPCPPLHPAVN